MSNPQQEAAAPAIIPPADLLKFNAWGKMGLAVSVRELAIQVEGQQIAASLLTPTDILQVPAAEEALKTAKFKSNGLVEKRKEITGKLDAVVTRMMGPEKSLAQAIEASAAAIIKVKQDDRATQQGNAAKTQETATLREFVTIYVAQRNASFQIGMQELISAAYKFALENIPPEGLETYLPKVAARAMVEKYTMPAPTVQSKLLTAEEVAAILGEVFTPRPATAYVDDFSLYLKEKFSDYNIAWENKATALAQDTQEAAAVVASINEEAQSSVVEAKLDAISTPIVTTTPGVKELKQVYEVDMPDDFESAIRIMTACVANAGKVRECTRTTKWDAFGVLAIKRALAKIKSDDNEFAPGGIVFKIVDKL